MWPVNLSSSTSLWIKATKTKLKNHHRQSIPSIDKLHKWLYFWQFQWVYLDQIVTLIEKCHPQVYVTAEVKINYSDVFREV